MLQLPDGDITAANAATLTGKLCQLANGAIYTDDGDTLSIHDRKLDALEDIIEAASGKPILVAYWFKHDLVCITERLQKLHVTFSKLDSADSIRKWNTGELPVALIHPASAGHGLNLSQKRRFHYHMVRADLNTGVISADQRPPMATRAKF